MSMRLRTTFAGSHPSKLLRAACGTGVPSLKAHTHTNGVNVLLKGAFCVDNEDFSVEESGCKLVEKLCLVGEERGGVGAV